MRGLWPAAVALPTVCSAALDCDVSHVASGAEAPVASDAIAAADGARIAPGNGSVSAVVVVVERTLAVGAGIAFGRGCASARVVTSADCARVALGEGKASPIVVVVGRTTADCACIAFGEGSGAALVVVIEGAAAVGARIAPCSD